jgi:hypothetical protein
MPAKQLAPTWRDRGQYDQAVELEGALPDLYGAIANATPKLSKGDSARQNTLCFKSGHSLAESLRKFPLSALFRIDFDH